MKKYITPLLITTSITLTGCDKKDENNTSSTAASSTQSSITKPTASTAPTGQLPVPVIAAIDVQRILDASTATAEIREEIEKKRSEIQNEMSQHEARLRKEEQQLAKDSETLSQEDFQKKRDAFEKQVANVQMKLNVRKLQLETAFEQARSKVYEAFLAASDVVRHDMGANIVLYKEQVVVADTVFDITEPVLERLNSSLPGVKVEYQDEAEILKQLKSQSQS